MLVIRKMKIRSKMKCGFITVGTAVIHKAKSGCWQRYSKGACNFFSHEEVWKLFREMTYPKETTQRETIKKDASVK